MKCKSCNGAVIWKRKPGSGKWQCFEADGKTSHWDTCSQRRFQKIKDTGEYFEDPDAKGYLTDLKNSGIQYTEQRAPLIRAKKPLSGACTDCVPAWEVCPKPCPDAIGARA